MQTVTQAKYLGASEFGCRVLAKQLPAGGVEGLAVVRALPTRMALSASHLKLLHPAGI